MDLWSSRPPTTTPGSAHGLLVAIARTFGQIDRVMLAEIQDDISRCNRPPSVSRFSHPRVPQDVISYIEDVENSTSHTSSETDVLAYLSDTKCLTAWSHVRSSMLEHQGNAHDYRLTAWSQVKDRAAEMLNLAQQVLEKYGSDECQDRLLPENEHVHVRASIEAKLSALLLFGQSIYSRPNLEEAKSMHIPPEHGFVWSFGQFRSRRNDKIKEKRTARYDATYQNVSKRLDRTKLYTVN